MDVEVRCPVCGNEYVVWVEDVELFKDFTSEGFCPYCGCGIRHTIRFVIAPVVINSECTKRRLSDRQAYQRL